MAERSAPGPTDVTYLICKATGEQAGNGVCRIHGVRSCLIVVGRIDKDWSGLPTAGRFHVNPYRASQRALDMVGPHGHPTPDLREAIVELAHGLASLARQTLGEEVAE